MCFILFTSYPMVRAWLMVSEYEMLYGGCDRSSHGPINLAPTLGQFRLRQPTDTCKVPLTGIYWACVTPTAHQLLDNIARVTCNQASNEIALLPACIK